jgi:L-serine dehydratase
MFISTLELFTLGIGPSSSHTVGPMVAAGRFRGLLKAEFTSSKAEEKLHLQCTLKGSLSYTGKGHASDKAIALGLHGFTPEKLLNQNVDDIIQQLWTLPAFNVGADITVKFSPENDILFDRGEPLPEHTNGMIFRLVDSTGKIIKEETYFSIGGGFVHTRVRINAIVAPLKMESSKGTPYPFDSAKRMLSLARESGFSIAAMKRVNELEYMSEGKLNQGLDSIWSAMKDCVERGLKAEGDLPGGLGLQRRAAKLHKQLLGNPEDGNVTDWLCAYAMAISEENAAGHPVVTAPTNGAAGVIPAILYYWTEHRNGTLDQVRDFLLSAAAIGGLIKLRSSISGAEVGCQGEVGSASSMAAAGLCAIRGGTPEQVENAAEIALEHHLGVTCDPVNGLVQVPCIERNGFGAIKAYTAASLALRGTGQHFMSLDNCISAMKQTGLEMSAKFKETALGGLAVSITEC